MTNNTTPAAPSGELNLDHLEAKARAATPGEWVAKPHGRVVGGPMRQYVNGSAQAQIAAFSVTFHEQAPEDEPERQQANTEFCAAANPAAVLELIALARQAQSSQPSKAAPLYDIGALREQSDAWHAVHEVLSEVMPEWHSMSRRGMDSAVMAIRKLATPSLPAPAQAAGDELRIKPWRERVNLEAVRNSRRALAALEYAEDEIAELRAALANQPAPTVPAAPRKMSWTDSPYKTDYYQAQAWAAGWNEAVAHQPAQEQASTTRVTETKCAQLEARGYEVVGYVMQNSVTELCTLAHGRVEWLGKPAQAAQQEPLAAAPVAARQDLQDVFSLTWSQALSAAALYVDSHCALDEHHIEHILKLAPPKLKVRGVDIAFLQAAQHEAKTPGFEGIKAPTAAQGEPTMLWDADDPEDGTHGDSPQDFAENYISNSGLSEAVEVDVLCAYRGGKRTMLITPSDEGEVSWSWTGGAASPAVRAQSEESRQPMPDWLAYDVEADVLTIYGIRYAGCVLRDFSNFMPLGQPFVLDSRSDGVLTLTRLQPDAGAQQAHAGADEDSKGGALWRATMRACSELPEGYEVRIELESGCGMAVWYDAEGERHVIDGEGYLSDDVDEAVDAAIRAAQEGGAA